jgi:hypothetical protein
MANKWSKAHKFIFSNNLGNVFENVKNFKEITFGGG